MAHGPTLHLQNDYSGLGSLRSGLLTMDRVMRENVQVVGDPHQLPFPDGTFRCIVGVDVLAESVSAAAVLAECERVLVPFGRLILLEPWTGPLGLALHRYQHRRRVWAGQDPWFDACPQARPALDDYSPYEDDPPSLLSQGFDWLLNKRLAARVGPLTGNADIAHACFLRRREELGRHAPGLSVVSVEAFGGLSEWMANREQTTEAGLARMMAAEKYFPGWLRYLLGSRALCVVEKVSLHRDR